MTEDKEMIVQIIEKPGTVGTLKAAKLKDLILAFAAIRAETGAKQLPSAGDGLPALMMADHGRRRKEGQDWERSISYRRR